MDSDARKTKSEFRATTREKERGGEKLQSAKSCRKARIWCLWHLGDFPATVSFCASAPRNFPKLLLWEPFPWDWDGKAAAAPKLTCTPQHLLRAQQITEIPSRNFPGSTQQPGSDGVFREDIFIIGLKTLSFQKLRSPTLSLIIHTPLSLSRGEFGFKTHRKKPGK